MRTRWVVSLVGVVLAFLAGASKARAQGANEPELPRVQLDTAYLPPRDGRVHYPANTTELRDLLPTLVAGDRVVLRAGVTYNGAFTLPAVEGDGWIYIESSEADKLPPPGARVGPGDVAHMATITTLSGGPALQAAPSAHHFRLVGIELTVAPNVKSNLGVVALGTGDASQSSLDVVPHDLVLDRCYIHGNETGNVFRGIALNSASTAIIGCYISECHVVGFDAQGICGWNGPGPFKIVNNYIEGAAENVLFGGADPKIPDLVPSDIEFRRNTLAKPLSWNPTDPTFDGVGGDTSRHWTVKNLFELKNARRVLVDGNLFEYCWLDAQIGFAIVLTPRNQGGTASWSCVQDVTVTNNLVQHSAGGVNLLGYDDNHESAQAQRVLFRNNLFVDIGGTQWGANGRLFLVKNAVAYLTIDHNTAFQTGNVVTADLAPSIGFTFTNNIVPHNAYGVLGSGFGVGNPSIQKYFPASRFSRNVLVGGMESQYPSGNYFPATLDDVGFVDRTGGNYSLAATSPFRGVGTDSRDLGVDTLALATAQAGVSIARVVAVAGSPFRLKIVGANFVPGVEVFIGDGDTPWATIRVKSSRTILVDQGRPLTRALPAGVAVPIRVLNPNGDEATLFFTRGT